MSHSLAFLLMLAFSASGCATISTVEAARGSGPAQIYEYPYDHVYDIAVNSLREQKIKIVEENRETGTILAKKGMSLLSWGEKMAVFVSKINDHETRVEVISRRALTTNFIARDWTDRIFSGIEKNLGGYPVKK